MKSDTLADEMARNPMRKVYLGDGCYAGFDGCNLVLTTENGISVQNTVVLEPAVFNHMLLYVDRLRQELNDDVLRG